MGQHASEVLQSQDSIGMSFTNLLRSFIIFWMTIKTFYIFWHTTVSPQISERHPRWPVAEPVNSPSSHLSSPEIYLTPAPEFLTIQGSVSLKNSCCPTLNFTKYFMKLLAQQPIFLVNVTPVYVILAKFHCDSQAVSNSSSKMRNFSQLVNRNEILHKSGWLKSLVRHPQEHFKVILVTTLYSSRFHTNKYNIMCKGFTLRVKGYDFTNLQLQRDRRVMIVQTCSPKMIAGWSIPNTVLYSVWKSYVHMFKTNMACRKSEHQKFISVSLLFNRFMKDVRINSFNQTWFMKDNELWLSTHEWFWHSAIMFQHDY